MPVEEDDPTQGNLHVMMGIPGSGKSTVAERIKQMHNAVHISPDRIREILTGDASNQDKNAQVFNIAHTSTEGNLKQGHHVIFDATNVRADQRKPLLDIAKRTGAQAHLHIVNPGLDVASKRNADRTERVVPQDILDRMHGEMVESGASIPTEGWDTVRTYE